MAALFLLYQNPSDRNVLSLRGPKTWRREPMFKCPDTDNWGSDNREPTVTQKE